MLSDGEIKHGVGDVSDVNLDEAFKEMKAKLRHDPNREDLPISSLAEYINKGNVHIVRMQNEVEELIFPSASLNNNQIARLFISKANHSISQ